MERRHIDGFFVARFSSDHRPDYKLRIESLHGFHTFKDPYSFGSVFDTSAFHALQGKGELDKYLGAQLIKHGGADGVLFWAWAPNAHRVSVIADFNGWDGRQNPMRLRHEGGRELFVPGISAGVRYKFEIISQDGRLLPPKADPLAFAAECPPATASIVHGWPGYNWTDGTWMEKRQASPRDKAMSIYECHLGSWARVPEDGNRYLTYHELAERLVTYVKDMGFTHIELLPVTEYPFDGSWGYQPVSLYAPMRRFGGPGDFAAFVEAAHAAELGIILDWVPAHFPNDLHGLGEFDGTHLYEHADPRQGFHRDWGTYIYNYGK
jgi:1,4-alpha-glucan branching enzyme